MELRERLDTIAARFDSLGAQMADPAIVGDPDRYRQIAKSYSDLEHVVGRYREYQKVEGEIGDARALEKDPDLRAMALEDIAALEPKREALLAELRELLLPRDPNDEKNVILEIRAGTGGEEASLFASELFRMYSRYAERRGWVVEVLTMSTTGLGGLKEVIALISGKQVYSRLKHESGVHRVQRVPATESAGRIHTSTATVAVLPEADDVQVQVNEKDLRIDTFCATGPGGQGVNTTYSAIRITHLPTGLVVQCQDERSQHKNKARAMKVLRSRLLEVEQQKQRDAIAQDRRSQVGTGERSEKIRTYNFPQNRVTDHRVNVTLHRLPELMDGALDPLVEPIVAHYQAERLKEEVSAGA
ncbi:MAG TPA: peptide chain release factor 1 [Verrucomicrobiae bacterium]|nr:peptide chain release factor 1 [Verrucomicrobiae bacterium]